MTVEELIEVLQSLPPTATVVIEVGSDIDDEDYNLQVVNTAEYNLGEVILS